MKIILPLFILCLCSLLFSSCDRGDKQSKLEKRRAQDLFFSSAAVASLTDFKNEAATFPTDYLRLYKNDPIAWQPWDNSLQEKASNCQTPILLLVVSAVNGNCRDTIQRIYEDAEMLNLLRDHNLCTLVDIHANPEIGLLAQKLSSDSGQAISFPSLIWLSHEKLPIASFSIGMMNDKQLKTAVKNAGSMVQHIWKNSSDYAVTNSRQDNIRRQEQIDTQLKGESLLLDPANDLNLPPPTSRSEYYRSSTRKIVSLFNPISKSFDNLGGILPASALELVGTSSRSPHFTQQIRRAARLAFSETTDNIQQNAASDALGNGYFQSKRGPSWELPLFSKRLDIQTHYATALLRSGQATEHQRAIREGLRLADYFISQLPDKLYASETSLNGTDLSGQFLWDWQTLSDHLSDDELQFFSKIYSLRKHGNIPATVDPTGKHFKLNTFQLSQPWEQIADSLNLSLEELEDKISPIRAKLLTVREKNSELFRETQISAAQLSTTGSLMISAWAASGEEKYLHTARTIGSQLIAEYRSERGSHTRFANLSSVLARGEDFAAQALFFLNLYQATFDQKWLKASREITENALIALARDDFPLQECQKNDQIIPVFIHNHSMIFGQSTTGILDQVFTRFLAISDDERFKNRRDLNTKRYRIRLDRIPIIHTDLLTSYALGDTPYLIAVSGEPDSPAVKKARQQLNSSHFTTFATIASASLPELDIDEKLPPMESGFQIGLYRNGKLIADAENIDSFSEIFTTEMAKKE
ncbi:MAG: DUF255 domain-containing protein [Akkermansiaceae bacterium]